MEQTECSETSAYKIQAPGNYQEENIQHSEHGESLKSRAIRNVWVPEKGDGEGWGTFSTNRRTIGLLRTNLLFGVC
jgi:hypothetical protein